MPRAKTHPGPGITPADLSTSTPPPPAAPQAPPVLLLSGYAVGSGDRVAGLDGGADAYLTKPADPTVLLAQTRALLRAPGLRTCCGRPTGCSGR